MGKNSLDAQLTDTYPFLLMYGISLTGSKTEAEDLVQEAVYRFLLIYDQLKDSNYKAWIMRVMRNFYFDEYRHRKRKQKLLKDLSSNLETIAPDLTEGLIQSKTYEKLYAHLRSLAPVYQEVLIAHYFAELSVKEIAELTKLTPSNVKVILHRGRKQLKERFLLDEKL